MANSRLVDVPTPVPGIRILYDFINEAEEAYLLEVSSPLAAPPHRPS